MRDDRGQTEILGELLLVGVVVLVISVAGAVVLGDVAEPRDRAYADVEATVEGGSLALVHRGGEPLPTGDLRVRVAVNGTPGTGVTWANGTVAGDGDDLFELGERWTHSVAGSNARVAVTLAVVADDGTGTVVYRDDIVTGSGGAAPPVGTPAPGSPPVADAGVNRSVQGERGETVALDGTGTTDPDGDPVTYEWSVVDADGIGGSVDLRDADTPTPMLAVTGNMTDSDHAVRVRLRASDGDGATTDETVVTVREFDPPPTADAGPNRTVEGAAGESVTLDGRASDSGGPGVIGYQWAIVDRDGLPESAVELVGNGSQKPTFRVTERVTDRTHEVGVLLTVTDGDETDTDRVTVMVRPASDDDLTPPPTANATATPRTATAGQQVTFDGSESGSAVPGGLDYAWDFDGDGRFEGRNETATTRYKRPGTYDAVLRVTDARGRSAADTVTVKMLGVVDAVNFGGAGGTFDGVAYRGDDDSPAESVTGGDVFTTTDEVADTDAQTLYRTQRQGEFSYDRQVENGTYEVTVQYAEIEIEPSGLVGLGSFGERQFDVRVEGREVETNFDVYAEARGFDPLPFFFFGDDRAVVRTYTVTVTDGSLNVTFATGAAGEPAANGIVVERTG
jgi:hypothetical protein